MKKLIIILFVLAQVVCFAQSNVVTEIIANQKTIVISNPHELTWVGNQNGSYDITIAFVPTSAELLTLLENFKKDYYCTVNLKLWGQTLTTAGTVLIITANAETNWLPIESTYAITITGGELINPYK